MALTLPNIPLPGLPKLPSPGDLKTMVSPTIADGAFSGGAKDELATADIYKLTSSVGNSASKPITSIQELRAAIDETTLGNTLDAGIASDFLSKSKDGLSFNKDLLTSRILGTNGEFKATFSELTEQMKSGALTSAFKDKADSLMCMVNDTRSMVDSANIGSVKALGAFVNKYTGSSIFSGQDKGAMAGLLSSVITTSSNLGVSGAFSAIAGTVNDTGILGRVTRAVLPVALRNSDSRMLREIASSPAGALINVFNPGFTQSFSKGFTYKGAQSNSLATFNDIFTSFRGISQTWDQVTRQGGNALDLISIIGSSPDFRNLVHAGVKYWTEEQRRQDGSAPPVPVDPLYALATAFNEVTVGQAVQRDFPRVALLSVYNERLPTRSGLPAGTRPANNAHVIDARLLKITSQVVKISKLGKVIFNL